MSVENEILNEKVEQKINNVKTTHLSIIPPLLSKSPPNISLNIENDNTSFSISISTNHSHTDQVFDKQDTTNKNIFDSMNCNFSSFPDFDEVNENKKVQQKEGTCQISNLKHDILINEYNSIAAIDNNEAVMKSSVSDNDDIWNPFNSNIKFQDNKHEGSISNKIEHFFDPFNVANIENQNNTNWANFDNNDFCLLQKVVPISKSNSDESNKNKIQNELEIYNIIETENKERANSLLKESQTNSLNKTNASYFSNEENLEENLNSFTQNIKKEPVYIELHSEKLNANNEQIEDEDDFDDFVETTTIFDLGQIYQTNEKHDQNFPDNYLENQSRQNILHSKNLESTPIVKIVDYDMIIKKLFEGIYDFKSISQNCKNIEALNNCLIDYDETWKQLKTYTSVTDASISLKFKWLLSDLEGNYLKSLNLERKLSQKSYILSPTLAQPFKIDSTSLKEENKPTQILNENINTLHNSNSIFKLDDILNPKQTLEQNHVNNMNFCHTENASSMSTSEAIELDLSFFEAKQKDKNNSDDYVDDCKFNSNNATKKTVITTTNNIINNSSKVYLDKLLKDIFVKGNNQVSEPETIEDNQLKKTAHDPISKANISKSSIPDILKTKEEEILSDKKSISPSSNPSSILSTNEAIKLQPHKLEEQQNFNQVKKSTQNDRKKLDIITNSSNLNLKNGFNSETYLFAQKITLKKS